MTKYRKKPVLCWLGIHKWYLGGRRYISPVGYKHRYCIKCGLEQQLDTSWGRWRFFGIQAKNEVRDA